MICPQFTLPGIFSRESENQEKTYTLENIAKTEKVLLYFYPKDDTPGCSLQATEFTAYFQNFLDLGVTVVGVSPDDISSHCNFQAKKELGILLLSDPEKTLIEPIGAWGEKINYGKTYTGLIRSTFLIDRNSGEILESWKNIRAKGHVERILKILSDKK